MRKPKKAYAPNNVIHLTFPRFDFELFLMRVIVAMSRTGMTYCDLAHWTNLSEATIARIMSRRSKNMMVGTASQIARALRVSAEYLLDQRPARTKQEKEIEHETQYNLSLRRRKAFGP